MILNGKKKASVPLKINNLLTVFSEYHFVAWGNLLARFGWSYGTTLLHYLCNMGIFTRISTFKKTEENATGKTDLTKLKDKSQSLKTIPNKDFASPRSHHIRYKIQRPKSFTNSYNMAETMLQRNLITLKELQDKSRRRKTPAKIYDE